jgi:hypothetical protein
MAMKTRNYFEIGSPELSVKYRGLRPSQRRFRILPDDNKESETGLWSFRGSLSNILSTELIADSK